MLEGKGTLEEVSDCLQADGASLDPAKREFLVNDVPVHLVTLEQTGFAPMQLIEIEQIRTVSLADLISLKLKSGTGNIRRTRDISDVIGLIEANGLTDKFTPQVAKPFRTAFEELLSGLAREG